MKNKLFILIIFFYITSLYPESLDMESAEIKRKNLEYDITFLDKEIKKLKQKKATHKNIERLSIPACSISFLIGFFYEAMLRENERQSNPALSPETSYGSTTTGKIFYGAGIGLAAVYFGEVIFRNTEVLDKKITQYENQKYEKQFELTEIADSINQTIEYEKLKDSVSLAELKLFQRKWPNSPYKEEIAGRIEKITRQIITDAETYAEKINFSKADYNTIINELNTQNSGKTERNIYYEKITKKFIEYLAVLIEKKQYIKVIQIVEKQINISEVEDRLYSESTQMPDEQNRIIENEEINLQNKIENDFYSIIEKTIESIIKNGDLKSASEIKDKYQEYNFRFGITKNYSIIIENDFIKRNPQYKERFHSLAKDSKIIFKEITDDNPNTPSKGKIYSLDRGFEPISWIDDNTVLANLFLYSIGYEETYSEVLCFQLPENREKEFSSSSILIVEGIGTYRYTSLGGEKTVSLLKVLNMY